MPRDKRNESACGHFEAKVFNPTCVLCREHFDWLVERWTKREAQNSRPHALPLSSFGNQDGMSNLHYWIVMTILALFVGALILTFARTMA